MISYIANETVLFWTRRKDNIFINAMHKSKITLPVVNLVFPNLKPVLIPIVQ